MGCLTTSIKLSVFKSDPGEVDIKKYLKHREFRFFFAKKIKTFQSVYLAVQDKIVQNWLHHNSGISEKNTKSESFVHSYWAPKGATFPEGVI